MESVDKICDKIREDGAKEVDSILEKAKRTAARAKSSRNWSGPK